MTLTVFVIKLSAVYSKSEKSHYFLAPVSILILIFSVNHLRPFQRYRIAVGAVQTLINNFYKRQCNFLDKTNESST